MKFVALTMAATVNACTNSKLPLPSGCPVQPIRSENFMYMTYSDESTCFKALAAVKLTIP